MQHVLLYGANVMARCENVLRQVCGRVHMHFAVLRYRQSVGASTRNRRVMTNIWKIVSDLEEARAELRTRGDVARHLVVSEDVWLALKKECRHHSTEHHKNQLFGLDVRLDRILPSCSVIGFGAGNEIVLMIVNGNQVDMDAVRVALELGRFPQRLT